MAKTIEVKRTVNEKENAYVFEQAKLKSKEKGAPARFAFVPKKPVSDEDYQKVVDFLGMKDLVNLGLRVWRQFSVNWSNSAAKKTNGAAVESEVWQTTFAKLAADMSAEGLSMKALRAEETDLKQQLFALIANTALDPVKKVEEMTVIGKRMKEIQDSLAARAADKDTDEEEEVDTESGNGAEDTKPEAVTA